MNVISMKAMHHIVYGERAVLRTAERIIVSH